MHTHKCLNRRSASVLLTHPHDWMFNFANTFSQLKTDVTDWIVNIATITLVLRQHTNLLQWQAQRRSFCLHQHWQTNLIHINMCQWMMGSEGRVVATAVFACVYLQCDSMCFATQLQRAQTHGHACDHTWKQMTLLAVERNEMERVIPVSCTFSSSVTSATHHLPPSPHFLAWWSAECHPSICSCPIFPQIILLILCVYSSSCLYNPSLLISSYTHNKILSCIFVFSVQFCCYCFWTGPHFYL